MIPKCVLFFCLAVSGIASAKDAPAATAAKPFDSKAFIADVVRLQKAHGTKTAAPWTLEQFKALLPEKCGRGSAEDVRPIAMPGSPPAGVSASYPSGNWRFTVRVEEESPYPAAHVEALKAAVQMNERNAKAVGTAWTARRFDPAPDTAGYLDFHPDLDSVMIWVQAHGHWSIIISATGVKNTEATEACARAVKWTALEH